MTKFPYTLMAALQSRGMIFFAMSTVVFWFLCDLLPFRSYMKTTDKGEEQWVVETSNEHNFLSNTDFLTILSALESLDNELSENSMFSFLVLFCIQNGI